MNENIHVTVRCEYRADSSEPAASRYAFAYHITISNRSNEHVQPRIPPGESYQYTSGAMLETAVGTMEGSYRMVRDDGREFSVPIPAFRLAVPHAVN